MTGARIVASLGLALCACAPDEDREYLAASDRQQPVAAQFTAIAETAVSTGVSEGIQFSLVEDGEVLVTQAFGLADRESKVPMTVNTPINVASVSKPLTAWGVVALAERRGIDLDAPVAALLHDDRLHDDVFRDNDVSLRMLLSHTSGLSGSSVPVTPATESVPSIMDILLGKSSVPKAVMERPPGGRFSYSGAGYLVLQQIIEDQTDRSFAAYMKNTVLTAARMDDSSFTLTPEVHDRLAVYYRGDGRRREPYHLPGAAGALYSTARDMARFIVLYTRNGRAVRNRIVSDEGFAALLGPIAPVDAPESSIGNLHYALGHYTYDTPDGTTIVFHAGGNPGLRALLVVAPDRSIGFFAVANNDRGSGVLSAMLTAWGQYYGLALHSHY